MAAPSAAPAGTEEKFGKIALPPISLSNFKLGAFVIVPKELSEALRSIGVSQENIHSYESPFGQALDNGLPSLLKTVREKTDLKKIAEECNIYVTGLDSSTPSTVSLPLADLADIPANDATNETVLHAVYVLQCAFVLGVSDEEIFRYLIRQFDLLCQRNDAHRHDLAFLFEKLTFFALEHKFFDLKANDQFGHPLSNDYAVWVERLTNAVNFIFIAAQKTSVRTPFKVDDATRKELCDILHLLWSASKEEVALLYAEFYWHVCRNVADGDNPTCHPLNVCSLSEKHHLVAECAEIAKDATPKPYRDLIFSQYCLDNWLQKDIPEEEKLSDFRIHAQRCVEIFEYSSNATFTPAPENRFEPLPKEDNAMNALMKKLEEALEEKDDLEDTCVMQ